MNCLRGSQCKFKLLHLPTGELIKFLARHRQYMFNNQTCYPVDSYHYDYNKWITYTLVKGLGIYIPHYKWVIEEICNNSDKVKDIKPIKNHFEVIWE